MSKESVYGSNLKKVPKSIEEISIKSIVKYYNKLWLLDRHYKDEV